MSVTRMVRLGFCVLLAGAMVASCTMDPPPGPLPDPIISCATIGGPISYSPPAQSLLVPVDITITLQPGAALSGCIDNTGTSSNITAGTITSATFLLPSFTCGVHAVGVVWGTGNGQIVWSNAAVSNWSAVFRGNGAAIGDDLEFTITSGLWTGATASVPMVPTSSDGNCVTTPVTNAVFGNTAPFVLHP
jgi:hypothetical protein